MELCEAPLKEYQAGYVVMYVHIYSININIIYDAVYGAKVNRTALGFNFDFLSLFFFPCIV